MQRLRLGDGKAEYAWEASHSPFGWRRKEGLYLGGNLLETDFLQAIPTGDTIADRQARLVVYYDVGMAHLLKGDQAGAREFFAKSIEINLINDAIFYLARAELARLPAKN